MANLANRIAGITVEIGGDTTKLSTTLKSVNTEIRSTQQQLKDVNSLLKLDPGKDALNGKIDLIITKSVSRFARNTVDSIRFLPDAFGRFFCAWK